VPASGFAGHEVFQMVIMEDLESSVDNPGLYHWIPHSQKGFDAACFPKHPIPVRGMVMI
jgi:hypothetical protein